ncbi:hypothetical protein BT96DRAFT_561877 [Gymnopus androsaceus JB14]|uniref:Uncharacterized protein n=1 Tax=Gymnopus androsaceus JB14 TaxID=1447944 RepID=A0A6A4GJR1_9AGAR|nr:hypothetical protein BT96DRAFT_561877 [Gymnopus androsaceus JB14]
MYLVVLHSHTCVISPIISEDIYAHQYNIFTYSKNFVISFPKCTENCKFKCKCDLDCFSPWP